MYNKKILFLMVGLIFVMVVIFFLSHLGIVSTTMSATITSGLTVVIAILSFVAKKPGSKE